MSWSVWSVLGLTRHRDRYSSPWGGANTSLQASWQQLLWAPHPWRRKKVVPTQAMLP